MFTNIILLIKNKYIYIFLVIQKNKDDIIHVIKEAHKSIVVYVSILKSIDLLSFMTKCENVVI